MERPAVVRVELTQHLFQFFPELKGRELVVEASTVADVMQAMEKIAPGFAFYVCDERGRLRQHVNVFIGEEMIVDRRRLSDRVTPDARVLIMQALRHSSFPWPAACDARGSCARNIWCAHNEFQSSGERFA